MSEFTVGQIVTVVEDGSYTRYDYGYARINEGTSLRVTRAYTQSCVVRDDVRQQSYTIEDYKLRLLKPEVDQTDPNRKLGTPPGDVEDAILPTDPRLDWLWKDAAQLAKQTHQCETYDDFCDKLGIPGRERSFNINVEINGMSTTFAQKARSKAEAQQLVEENFKKLATGKAEIKTS